MAFAFLAGLESQVGNRRKEVPVNNFSVDEVSLVIKISQKCYVIEIGRSIDNSGDRTIM